MTLSILSSLLENIFGLRYSFQCFLRSILNMFVVRLMVEQADAGSIIPLGMLANSARVEAWVGCINVWLVQLQCSSLTL